MFNIPNLFTAANMLCGFVSIILALFGRIDAKLVKEHLKNKLETFQKDQEQEAKEKQQEGTVIAVGNGTKDEPMTVKVGDTVLYGKYGGTELKLEGKDYLMMRESDILAII